jgi:hypothetical protein
MESPVLTRPSHAAAAVMTLYELGSIAIQIAFPVACVFAISGAAGLGSSRHEPGPA